MLGWALLTIVFAIADLQLNGFHAGPFVTAILTNIYLAKFFMWETGYFNTLDITLDRAGYYLCWGCLCWVQIFYTFTSLFMVGHPSKISNFAAFAILIYGLISIMLNYAVDRQKEVFRTNNGKCHIWGRPAKFLVSALYLILTKLEIRTWHCQVFQNCNLPFQKCHNQRFLYFCETKIHITLANSTFQFEF